MAYFTTRFDSEYSKLYDEFYNKWHFTLSGLIGNYALVLSNQKYFKLYKIVADKRCSNGTKYKKVFVATTPDEMRKYLTEQTPEF